MQWWRYNPPGCNQQKLGITLSIGSVKLWRQSIGVVLKKDWGLKYPKWTSVWLGTVPNITTISHPTHGMTIPIVYIYIYLKGWHHQPNVVRNCAMKAVIHNHILTYVYCILYIYMYIYICVYIYMHIYIHIYISHIYIYINK